MKQETKFNEKVGPRTVVRLSTSSWANNRGVFIKKHVRILRGKTNTNEPLFEYDVEMSGAEDAIKLIVNLYSVSDGVYELKTINQYSDPETGHMEDWRFKLVPYVEKTKKDCLQQGETINKTMHSYPFNGKSLK